MAFPLRAEHLRVIGVTEPRINAWIIPLAEAMSKFEITAGERPFMFLAQVAHESALFSQLAELWGPTPAQARYENRADLGNDRPEAGGPGNGFRWRGHGAIQITGYNNHLAEANYFGIHPSKIVEWLVTPEGGSKSAAHFWYTHGCNALADAYDFVGVTRKINGGINGLDARADLYKKISAIY